MKTIEAIIVDLEQKMNWIKYNHNQDDIMDGLRNIIGDLEEQHKGVKSEVYKGVGKKIASLRTLLIPKNKAELAGFKKILDKVGGSVELIHGMKFRVSSQDVEDAKVKGILKEYVLNLQDDGWLVISDS